MSMMTRRGNQTLTCLTNSISPPDCRTRSTCQFGLKTLKTAGLKPTTRHVPILTVVRVVHRRKCAHQRFPAGFGLDARFLFYRDEPIARADDKLCALSFYLQNVGVFGQSPERVDTLRVLSSAPGQRGGAQTASDEVGSRLRRALDRRCRRARWTHFPPKSAPVRFANAPIDCSHEKDLARRGLILSNSSLKLVCYFPRIASSSVRDGLRLTQGLRRRRRAIMCSAARPQAHSGVDQNTVARSSTLVAR